MTPNSPFVKPQVVVNVNPGLSGTLFESASRNEHDTYYYSTTRYTNDDTTATQQLQQPLSVPPAAIPCYRSHPDKAVGVIPSVEVS